jgi:dihydropyrimidinase
LLLHDQAEACRRQNFDDPQRQAGEDRMPVLWNAGVNTGRLTKEEFVASPRPTSPAILNMYPKKGAVAVGSDADIVIWDPAATKRSAPRTR